jgi:hypothetical protein
MVGGTVKQFKDALEEMRAIYPFDDEKTQICTRNERALMENQLSIITTDEKTGIFIQMSKEIDVMR